MQKIILFYKFIPVADTETVMHWQRTLCESLELKGRIIISRHGINGTLGGEVRSLKDYVKAMNLHSAFKKIDYKWSDGGADDFPKLRVKVRPEIVTFGVPDEVEINESGVVGGGQHITPEQVHKLAQKYKDELVFMDGRNAYEAAIGRFKNAVVPNTKTTKDFVEELEKPEMQSLKDKPIVAYCTGGIRCEVLTSLMKKRGFKDVYQIKGGIAKYGEKFGDDGLWEGKMYVFDNRMKVAFSGNSQELGDCIKCSAKTSDYMNCANDFCSKLILLCAKCSQGTISCSEACEAKLQVAPA